MSDFARCTKANPCPICGSPDYCQTVIDRGIVMCMNQPNGSYFTRKTDAGKVWMHRLTNEHHAQIAKLPRRPLRSKLDSRRLTKWARTWHQRAFHHERMPIASLAAQLDVSADILRLMRVGFVTWEVLWQTGTVCPNDHSAWVFPLRTGDMKIVGMALRVTDGSEYSIRGGTLGIYAPIQQPEDQRTLLIVKGGANTACALAMGFAAIGRYSDGSGAEDAATYCRGNKFTHAVIVQDKERSEMARRAAGICLNATVDALKWVGVQVRVLRPAKHKDLQEARLAGVTREQIIAIIKRQPLA